MHVAVIDIGKPNANLGWAIRGPQFSAEGTDLDQCIENIVCALGVGSLALGFEAPLFVPMRSDASGLTKARNGECRGGINRPFSAAAGASVLVTALTVIPYVLAGVRSRAPEAVVTLDWHSPPPHRGMLIFEAFVTDQKKTGPQRHIEDSLAAIAAFQNGYDVARLFVSAVEEPNCFGLIGAMLMRTGWTTDATILHQPCLVVKA